MLALKYPLTAQDGKISLTSDTDLILRQHIRHALETALEELVMLPEYGLEDHTFDSLDSLQPVLASARQSIELSLAYFDASFSLEAQMTDDGVLSLTCVYQDGQVTVVL